jgi:hypothetical protein
MLEILAVQAVSTYDYYTFSCVSSCTAAGYKTFGTAVCSALTCDASLQASVARSFSIASLNNLLFQQNGQCLQTCTYPYVIAATGTDDAQCTYCTTQGNFELLPAAGVSLCVTPGTQTAVSCPFFRLQANGVYICLS